MKSEALATRPVRTSLVENILQSLRKQIELLHEGERLPTVRQLMKQFGVSQLAVQAALDELKAAGQITSHVGRGTFVAHQPEPAGEKITTVTIVCYDYPSRRGEEITRALHGAIQDHKWRAATLTCSEHGHAMEVLRDAPVADGYILQPLNRNIPVKLLEFLQRRSRTILVEGYPAGCVDVDAVVTDVLTSVELAVRHLMELGHRQISIASGEPGAKESEMLRCFSAVMRWAGLPTAATATLVADTEPGASSCNGMRICLTEDLAHHGRLPFSGLVVWGHASALGVLAALHDAGLAVPHDVSLVVLDNTDLDYSAGTHLTTVGRSSQRIAQDLVKRLHNRLEHKSEPYGTVYELPELLVRASTQSVTVVNSQ